MSAYHQMGHASRNLVESPHLREIFAGAIMSPLNESPNGLGNLCRAIDGKQAIFDPQLYAPASTKGNLREWPYYATFHSQYTANKRGIDTWNTCVKALLSQCEESGLSALCSPAIAPKESSDDGLAFAVLAGNQMAKMLRGSNLSGLQTATFRTASAEGPGRPETIASILTSGDLERLYVVPRWNQMKNPLSDSEELAAFGKTLRYIASERETFIGFCGEEMILWKALGAQHVASGKFANQQRFDIARFEKDAGGGGGNTAYYFEESLLAWLRYEDIVSLLRLGYEIGNAGDPFLAEIRERIAGLQKDPPRREPIMKNGRVVRDKRGKIKTRRMGAPDWVGLGWAQWLWWFGSAERRLDAGEITAHQLVEDAQRNWAKLRTKHFIAQDAGNDGTWLSSWAAVLQDA